MVWRYACVLIFAWGWLCVFFYKRGRGCNYFPKYLVLKLPLFTDSWPFSWDTDLWFITVLPLLPLSYLCLLYKLPLSLLTMLLIFWLKKITPLGTSSSPLPPLFTIRQAPATILPLPCFPQLPLFSFSTFSPILALQWVPSDSLFSSFFQILHLCLLLTVKSNPCWCTTLDILTRLFCSTM